jgi:hypothetical protein
MLFLTRWFGVTGSDAERNLDAEQACIEEIVKKALLLQANAAAGELTSRVPPPEPCSKYSTLPLVAILGWRRGSRGEYSRCQACIPLLCGLETPIRS